ncbi:MAG: hypothetical protein ACR2JY_17105 [Chloroflexota bacterium]
MHALIPAPSPVRQVLRDQPRTWWGEWSAPLASMRSQGHVFRPAFWFLAALVVALNVLGISGMNVPPVLSLRLPVVQAAGFTYAAWLVLLALHWLVDGVAVSLPFTASTEPLLGGVGVAFLVAAVYALAGATPRRLPHD